MDTSALLACDACPRLASFLADARAAHAADRRGGTWHDRPVAPWGDPAARLLVVGLAPGFRGANRTGRPFCGDQSGQWLYRALFEIGMAESSDPLAAGGALAGARVTNAVKCVPPENKPTPEEMRACRERWLEDELEAGPSVLVALGRIAHTSILAVAGRDPKSADFTHGARHEIRIGGRACTLFDAYHPSPQNTRTGRLSWDAFKDVFLAAAQASEADRG